MEYSLLTQYTSFVAVEEMTVTIGGEPRRVEVPVEMPEGVSYEGVFGDGGGGWGRFRGKAIVGGGSMLMRKPMLAFSPMKTGASNDESRGDLAYKGNLGIKGIKEDEKLLEAEKKTKVAEIKLAKPLQGLAGKLDKDGNYSAGKVVVKDGKIEVAVYLYKLDKETLDALKKLGFVKLLDAEAVKMVMGTIEVKQLEELAYLDVVRQIDLPSFSK